MLKTIKRIPFAPSRVFQDPSLQEIAAPWNSNVDIRAYELENELDYTYFNVIIPTTKQLLKRFAQDNSKVVDVGCGLGHLTSKVASWGYEVVGIDIAERVIDYASNKFPSISFQLASLQAFSRNHIGKFQVCIINMTLHNLGDTRRNIEAISSLLKEDGIVIASVPHPKNWFRSRTFFRNYAPFFEYQKTEHFQVPFKIKGGQIHPSNFHYFHRPVSFYETEIKNAGFKILFSDEPKNPSGEPVEDLLFCVWKKSTKQE